MTTDVAASTVQRGAAEDVLPDARPGHLLTFEEAGERWGCSKWTIRRWTNSGRLPVVNIAPPGATRATPRIREADLLALADELAQSPKAAK